MHLIIGIIFMGSFSMNLIECLETINITNNRNTVTATGNFKLGDVQLAYDDSNTTCAIGYSLTKTSIKFHFHGPTFDITNLVLVTSEAVPEDMYDTDSLSVHWGTEGNMVKCVPKSLFNALENTATYHCPGSGSTLVIAQGDGNVLTLCNTIITRPTDDYTLDWDRQDNHDHNVRLDSCSWILDNFKSRKDLLHFAKINENAKNYENMICPMKKVIEFEEILTTEELRMLAVAYELLVHNKNALLTAIIAVDLETTEYFVPLSFHTKYRSKIKSEIISSLKEVLVILNNRLIAMYSIEKDTESWVFIQKLLGEFYNMLSIFSAQELKEEYNVKALNAYIEADSYAAKLPVTNPTRLSVAISFSEFYYEYQDDKAQACRLAKNAFVDAILEVRKTEETFNPNILNKISTLEKSIKSFSCDQKSV